MESSHEKPDFLAIQEKWREKWAKQKVFDAELNPKKEKFFMTVPYPYISGSLHIGHARVVIEQDVYSRFMRMAGKNVLNSIAFHISGTPVLGISLAISEGDKEKKELYSSYVRNYVSSKEEVNKIIESFKDPFKIVEFFIPKMKDEFSKLGLAVDWRRSFTSGDDVHRALVDWQFRKYKEKNYLVQGKYPILYSLSLKSAVGEDDISEGDTNPVEKIEFTLLKFEFEDSFIIAATLRPETMFGQTNMWVNPSVEYIKANIAGENWIISKECAEKLSHQDKSVEILQKVSGNSFIGKTCKAPVIDKEIIILPSTHCDPDIGTGFVTSVPSDSPYDWVMLKELQESERLCHKYGLDYGYVKAIKPISIIKSRGYGEFPSVEIVEKNNISPKNIAELEKATQEIYKIGFHTGILKDSCGKYKGMTAIQAKEAIKKDIINQGKAEIFYETSRKAQSRDGGKVIVSLLENQWFLDFNAGTWKKDSLKCLKRVEIIPEKFKKQFEDVFEWLDKRPCARKRGLGTALPFDKGWVIESLSDSTLYITLYTISHIVNENKISFSQMNKDFFDYIFLEKLPIDQAEKKIGIKKEILESCRKSFQYWYPNDHRHTFTAHLANHLSFLIFAHAAIMPEKYWPKKFSFHGMVISEGQKMSKSKGNIVTLLDVINKYGTDAFRCFMCNTTSIDGTINWEESEVLRLSKHLKSLVFNLNELSEISKNAKKDEVEKFKKTHKQFASKFERSIKEATECLECMNLRSYSNIVLYNIFNDYKKELQKIGEDKVSVSLMANYIIERWILLLCPLAPHYSEELWEKLEKTGFASIESWPSFEKSLINEKEEFKEILMDNLFSDIRAVKQLSKLKAISKITIITPKKWKYTLFKNISETLKKTRNPGEIIKKVMQTDLKKEDPLLAKKIPKLIDKLPAIILPEKEEQEIISQNKKYLEAVFGARIEIISENYSNHPKSSNSFPGKPAILLE